MSDCLLAIEPIVDMGRTALNVSGQALIPAIVAKRHGILDQPRYDAKRIDGYVPVAVEAAGGTELTASDEDGSVGAGAEGGTAEGRAAADAVPADGSTTRGQSAPARESIGDSNQPDQ